jgi:hypothetical protein
MDCIKEYSGAAIFFHLSATYTYIQWNAPISFLGYTILIYYRTTWIFIYNL